MTLVENFSRVASTSLIHFPSIPYSHEVKVIKEEERGVNKPIYAAEIVPEIYPFSHYVCNIIVLSIPPHPNSSSHCEPISARNQSEVMKEAYRLKVWFHFASFTAVVKYVLALVVFRCVLSSTEQYNACPLIPMLRASTTVEGVIMYQITICTL
jgi:hypothetical protein